MEIVDIKPEVVVPETYTVELTREELERIYALSAGGCEGRGGEGGELFPPHPYGGYADGALRRLHSMIPYDIAVTAAERFGLYPPQRNRDR